MIIDNALTTPTLITHFAPVVCHKWDSWPITYIDKYNAMQARSVSTESHSTCVFSTDLSSSIKGVISL